MDKCDCCNLEVGRRDSHAFVAKPIELVRRAIVKSQEVPFRKEAKRTHGTIVVRDLSADIRLPVDQSQPTSGLLFHGDGCRDNRLQGSGKALS